MPKNAKTTSNANSTKFDTLFIFIVNLVAMAILIVISVVGLAILLNYLGAIFGFVLGVVLSFTFGIYFYKNQKKLKTINNEGTIFTLGSLFVTVVILFIFASFGINPNPGGGSLSTNVCVAQAGYWCQSPIYSHTTGQINVMIGQNTGYTWTNVHVVFVPQGSPTVPGGLPALVFSVNSITNGNVLYSGVNLTSGEQITMTLPVNGISTNSLTLLTRPIPAGTAATGAIWAAYTTMTNSNIKYAQIATLNVKAS